MNQIKTHIFDIKIYYEDTDAGGIVYHSKYLNFAERGRAEFLKNIGFTSTKIWNKYKIRFVVKCLTIKYIKSVILDEIVSVKTEATKISKARIIFNQSFFNNNNKITDLLVEVCCININGRVARIPNDIYYSLVNKG
tara:strand:- start:1206 stop:1616 length:411 start_codon:yes stop_codon:yes gene_type:complete